jgi:hypothetical protein
VAPRWSCRTSSVDRVRDESLPVNAAGVTNPANCLQFEARRQSAFPSTSCGEQKRKTVLPAIPLRARRSIVERRLAILISHFAESERESGLKFSKHSRLLDSESLRAAGPPASEPEANSGGRTGSLAPDSASGANLDIEIYI